MKTVNFCEGERKFKGGERSVLHQNEDSSIENEEILRLKNDFAARASRELLEEFCALPSDMLNRYVGLLEVHKPDPQKGKLRQICIIILQNHSF